MMNYQQALEILAKQIQNNQLNEGNWHFNQINSLSNYEILKIRDFTQNRLPNSYYQFLETCGSGYYFENEKRIGGIHFFDLNEMVENQTNYQKALAEDLLFEQLSYDENQHDLIMVGSQCRLC